MDEQPSNWELGRRLNDISGSLRELIGQREYGEYQRAVRDRLDQLDRAIDDAVRVHTDDVKDLNKRIDDEAKRAAAHSQWKTLIYVGLIPSLVAVAAILVTIWLHGSGK